jgi:hypothetical protein
VARVTMSHGIKADVVHRGLADASTVEIPYRSLTFY